MADWESTARAQADAVRTTTPAQRLAWLHEAIEFARGAGIRPPGNHLADDIAWDMRLEFDGDFDVVRRYGLNHAEEYGGMWIDNERQRLVVGITADVEGHAAALRRRLRHPEHLVLEPVRYSERQLVELRDGIYGQRDELLPLGIIVNGCGIKTDLNRVSVRVSELSDSVTAELYRRFGSDRIILVQGGPSRLV